MRKAQDRVGGLINKKEDDISIKLTSHILCKTYKWDYHTLANQPIPFVYDMLEVMRYLEKEKKKKMKK